MSDLAPQSGDAGGASDPPDRDGDNPEKRERGGGREGASSSSDGSKSKDQSGKSRDENPFSFRQFLAQGGDSSQGGARNTGARPKTRPRASVQPQPPPEPSSSALNGDGYPLPDGNKTSSSSGLPDFLRDYMSPPGFDDSPPLQGGSVSGAGVDGLPFDLTLSSAAKAKATGESRDRGRDHEQLPPPSSAADHHHHHHHPDGEDGAVNFSSLSLPDFLSDGVLASAEPGSSSSGAAAGGGSGGGGSGVGGGAVSESRRDVDVRHHHPADAQNLDSLRIELANCRLTLERERERSRVLEQKLERSRREGSCLEEPLLNAEIRLAEAISRAEHAEKTLTECEASRRALERKILKMREKGGDGVQADGAGPGVPSFPQNLVLMRVRRAAAQISLAAEVAEASLGQLLSGVESLKTVADELRALIDDADDESPDFSYSSGGACGSKKT